jgi:hypothetical protein
MQIFPAFLNGENFRNAGKRMLSTRDSFSHHPIVLRIRDLDSAAFLVFCIVVLLTFDLPDLQPSVSIKILSRRTNRAKSARGVIVSFLLPGDGQPN